MNPARRLDDLAAIEAECWRELGRAAGDAKHEWRVMALATRGLDGFGDARSVVVREVDGGHRRLLFYIDSRSPKVEQIRAEPRATLLAWSRSLSWQLRLRVRLEIETQGLKTSSRWALLKMTPAAQDYLSPLPPGAVLGKVAQPVRGTREHFAVVTAQVEAIDWTELAADGHRRARFEPGADPVWLQP